MARPKRRGAVTPPSPPAEIPAHLTVSEDRAPTGWDDWVEALGGGPFQCAGWARYRASAPRKRALFFTWIADDSSEPVAVALAVDTAVPGPLTARSIEFDAPPATRLRPHLLWPAAERWMRSQPAVADAWLGSFDGEQAWIDAGAVTRLELRAQPASEDVLLARMRTLARRSVRRAQRCGIEVDDDSARLREFVNLYGDTLRRLRQTKHANTMLVEPEDFTRRLAVLGETGVGRLFMAVEGDVPVAGAVFTAFGRRAFYLIGASNDRARQTGAMTAVLYRAIQEFSDSGFHCINLGGVSADAHLTSSTDHGLYEFKRGLGATIHSCRDARIVIRPMRSRFIHGARATRAALLRLGR